MKTTTSAWWSNARLRSRPNRDCGVRGILGIAFAGLFWMLPNAATAQQRVELELVLAIDASTSVDVDEYNLQRTGIAEAFRHPQVLAAIDGLGEEGMAVSIVQWSGPQKQQIAVDWTHVNSRD